MMPQSAWILITACAKPAVPLEDCEREYGRVTRSASPQRSRYTRPSSFPPSCTMQRPGLSIEKKVGLQEWFHQRCLRSIFGIKWQDHFSNEEVVKRASLPSINSILRQVQLRWAGYVTRMEDVRMPKAVFFSELQEGKRDRGAPRKRYKDQLKRQLAQAGISHQSWQLEASDRDSWRSSVSFLTVVSSRQRGMKPQRKDVGSRKSEQYPYHPKLKPSSVQSAVGLCASRIGLYSHQRACKN